LISQAAVFREIILLTAAGWGGAIYNTDDGALNISGGTTFTGNGINTVGTVVTGIGGAIYNDTGEQQP